MPKLHEGIVTPLKSLDRRFKAVLAAIGVYNGANSLTLNYNQLYAVGLGANPLELGSLNSVGSVISSVVSIPVGWLIDKYGVKRVLAAGLVLCAIVSALYGFATSWLTLLPAIMLMQLGFKLIMPLADIVIISITKVENRARLMGLSRTVWAIPSLLTPMAAAMIVTLYGGITVQGIRPLYFIQLSTMVVAAIFIIFKLEELHVRSSVSRSGGEGGETSLLEGFRELFRGESSLRKWILLMGLWRFGTSVSMPFVTLWMVYAKNADPYILGAISTVGILVSAILQIPVGVMADKMGRKKTFLIIRPLTYLGTIILITASNPQMLILAGLLGMLGFTGGFIDLSFIPFITMFWEAVPMEKRGRWFGITGVFDVLSVPAFLLGGFLWQEGLEELVLILPILIEVFIIMPIVLSIPETLHSTKSINLERN
ncbi:MAG: MFS transporter [Thermoproteota archaeon]